LRLDFWDWGDVLKTKDSVADNFFNSIRNRLGSIERTFNDVINQKDPNAFTNRLQELKNLLSKIIRRINFYISSLFEIKIY